jgi:1-acyl-sn-glycerol-3-phosphate acyltransferase
MDRCLRLLFFACVVRPLVLIVLGLNVLHRRGLPSRGPAVIAANHNSHLDALVLMSLFRLRDLQRVRPVAAADYFMSSGWKAWFSLRLIGILPLDRTGGTPLEQLFAPCHEALDRGEILILFPEGSRGRAEELGRVRKGLWHLLKNRRETPVVPVVMHGLGHALPKGEALLVPFQCDVVIGEPLSVEGSASEFTERLTRTYGELASHCLTRHEDDGRA